MAKRRKRSSGERRPREKAPTVSYPDPEGNVLVLRETLSSSTIAKIGEAPTSHAANLEDAWARREETLFERLAVSWEIAGLPLDDQKMLLGRYRMADAETRAWVRRTIAEHLERHIPELARPCPATFTLFGWPPGPGGRLPLFDVALPRLGVCVLAVHADDCARTGQTSQGTADMAEELRIDERLAIPLAEIELRASRSSGPGGQHANVTASRVEAVFDVEASRSLDEARRVRLLERLGPVVTAVAQDGRSQYRNLELALSRLAAKLAVALRVPKHRRPTKPSRASRRRRLDAKRRTGERKQARRRPSSDDDPLRPTRPTGWPALRTSAGLIHDGSRGVPMIEAMLGTAAAALIAKALDRAESKTVDKGEGVLRRLIEVVRERLAGGDVRGQVEALKKVEEVPDSASRIETLARAIDLRADEDPDFRNQVGTLIGQAEEAEVDVKAAVQVAYGANSPEFQNTSAARSTSAMEPKTPAILSVASRTKYGATFDGRAVPQGRLGRADRLRLGLQLHDHLQQRPDSRRTARTRHRSGTGRDRLTRAADAGAFGVVPFVARTDLRDELLAWLDSEAPFSGVVIGGAGGSGKTRLAVEICDHAEREGWLSGILTRIDDPASLEALAEAPKRRLVAIDYAESRTAQMEILLPLLASRATREAPVRVFSWSGPAPTNERLDRGPAKSERHARQLVGRLQGARPRRSLAFPSRTVDPLRCRRRGLRRAARSRQVRSAARPAVLARILRSAADHPRRLPRYGRVVMR